MIKIYGNTDFDDKLLKLRRTTQCAGVFTQSGFRAFENSNGQHTLVQDLIVPAENDNVLLTTKKKL